MASLIGWYGPLTDLSDAVSHVGNLVQLVVLVHRCNPVQYKLAKGGGEVLRTDIQVGDDTTPFFTVSLWHKQMAAMAVAGDVILLQNVKITKFGRFLEATTVQFSSLLPLIHPYELLVSKGVDELLGECRAGTTTKDKLAKVIKWVQRGGSALSGIRSNSFGKQLPRNWKVREQSEPQHVFLLSEVLLLRKSCKATFSASAGEIFLPITWRALGDSEKENMFVSRRIMTLKGSNVLEDFTCIGCQWCGSPLDSDNGSIFKHISASYFCLKTPDHLHIVGLIYRPFMLYVWDESEYIPLLVRNKAAEVLFGNLKAERVYSNYKEQMQKDIGKPADAVDICSSSAKEKYHNCKNINLHKVWLVLVKLLLQKGKDSPLKFEVAVNPSLDIENGKFEMISVSMSCTRTECSSC
ncbi:hypothetical protein M5689_025268 [Euphorbia peplus]|nr:hypothetical protein M5689_025268 [Euphorbia peplus]